jgi:cobalt-zinc-cadmium resistance protein CzcA
MPAMKVTCFLLALLLSKNLMNAQDTLYIDINEAVKIAINNYNFYNRPSYMQSSKSTFDLQPTEFNFRYGELYSPETGWQVEIRQEFGKLFQQNSIHELSQAQQNLETGRGELEKKQLAISVKSVYLNWIYLYNKLRNIEIKREYMLKYLNVAAVRLDLGESMPLDKLRIETKASEIETEYLGCLSDIESAETELRKFLLHAGTLMPSDTKLELYMIAKQSDTSEYTGKYYTDIFLNEYNYSVAETHCLKSGYFPDVSAGVFYQDIGNERNMAGISAGIKVPLWNISKRDEVKKAFIESENNKLKYENKRQNIQYEIENLKLKLDKCFVTIRHYQSHALPLSNSMINTATVAYQHEDIDFEEFFEMVLNAMKIKSEYLDCINNYNQTALQLELYSM